MKIILLKDVPRIGVKNQILDIAQVYAMNAFVSKGLARIATANDEKQQKEKENKKKEEKARESDKYIQVFTTLEKESVTSALIIKKKLDAKGHFYAKFSKHDVVDAVFNAAKVSISDSQIITDLTAITNLGEHTIELNVNSRKYKILVKIIKE